jgi:hypothetical protein
MKGQLVQKGYQLLNLPLEVLQKGKAQKYCHQKLGCRLIHWVKLMITTIFILGSAASVLGMGKAG